MGRSFPQLPCELWTLDCKPLRVVLTHRTSAVLSGGEAYAFDLAWLE